jgi:hypothetical protein
MASVPSYIFDILDKELYDMQCTLIRRISAEYGLKSEEVIAKFLEDPLKILPVTDTKIEITKRTNAAPPAADEERCNARVWNRGRGGQCSRRRAKECEFCGHHMKMYEKDGKLHHGRMNDPPPAMVFVASTKKKVLYK